MGASWVNSDVSSTSAMFSSPFLIHSDVCYRNTLLFSEEDMQGYLENSTLDCILRGPWESPSVYRLMCQTVFVSKGFCNKRTTKYITCISGM